MYAIDDYVFYGTAGVCRIADVVCEKFGNLPVQQYYVLSPVHGDSLAYVPTASEEKVSRIRKVMSREEIKSLIDDIPDEKSIWMNNERDRRERFSEKLGTGDSHELMRLVKTLHQEKERRSKAGKRIGTADARIMSAAESLLNEELAFVLQIDPAAVPAYIRAEMGKRQGRRADD